MEGVGEKRDVEREKRGKKITHLTKKFFTSNCPFRYCARDSSLDYRPLPGMQFPPGKGLGPRGEHTPPETQGGGRPSRKGRMTHHPKRGTTKTEKPNLPRLLDHRFRRRRHPQNLARVTNKRHRWIAISLRERTSCNLSRTLVVATVPASKSTRVASDKHVGFFGSG